MTTTPSPDLAADLAGTIVVAIDGSTGGERALAWAAHQAVVEHRTLRIAHTAYLTMGGSSLWLGQPGIDVAAMLEQAQETGRSLLEDARRRVSGDHSDLEVRCHLSRFADPRRMLLDLSQDAHLLVVGSRGHGPIASVLLGSVSATVVKHAVCPVVVVRRAEATAQRGGVVVAADDSEESRMAIELAYQLASYRGLPLIALRVIWDSAHLGRDEHVVLDTDADLDEERMRLSEATAGMREKFPDVRDRLELIRGLRDQELVRASRSADLLVLGTRSRASIHDVLFSSLTSIVERAECDVVVVHADVTATP